MKIQLRKNSNSVVTTVEVPKEQVADLDAVSYMGSLYAKRGIDPLTGYDIFQKLNSIADITGTAKVVR